MMTNIKVSRSQLSEIIESGRFLGNMINNLDKNALKDLAVLLAKDVFA